MDRPPDVLAAMREWQAVTDDLANIARGFDPAQLDRPSACGGWTNRQLLVHLATGYGVRASALQAVLQGSCAPKVDANEANADNSARLEAASNEVIVAEMLQVRGRVLELLSRLRTEHLPMSSELGDGKPLAEALAGLNVHDLEHAAELRG